MAACAPVLRPFVRYVKARITGQDPHHILRPFPTQTWHSSWYSHFWHSRSSSTKKESARSQGNEFDTPAKGWEKATKSGNRHNETDVTISLPIQGVQERQDSMTAMMPAHTLKMFDSGSTSTTQAGADGTRRDLLRAFAPFSFVNSTQRYDTEPGMLGDRRLGGKSVGPNTNPPPVVTSLHHTTPRRNKGHLTDATLLDSWRSQARLHASINHNDLFSPRHCTTPRAWLVRPSISA
ncbi:MAG: hypothetical protein Q9168_003580 [Polycauliona sp. 1 TL-2023]